jgi:folate-dependent phosphoribosylglycinamide formyltransferase PurN
MTARLVVIASGNGTNLQAIINACATTIDTVELFPTSTRRLH